MLGVGCDVRNAVPGSGRGCTSTSKGTLNVSGPLCRADESAEDLGGGCAGRETAKPPGGALRDAIGSAAIPAAAAKTRSRFTVVQTSRTGRRHPLVKR